MKTPKQCVEIFHLVLLKHLESKLDKTLFSLKGGCNLRFFYKSIRYSEDIDFDVRVIAKQTLQNKINKLLESPALIHTLHTKGLIINNFSAPKQTETTQRWKLSLTATGLSMPLPTKIEFSRRDMTEDILFEPIDSDIIRRYQLYPIMTNHYSIQAAFNQKVSALIHRTQTQARDIFDLKLLLDLGAKAKSLDEKTKKNIGTAIENSLTIGFAEFKSHVLAYLMEEYQSYYNSIKQWHEIRNAVIKILEDALV